LVKFDIQATAVIGFKRAKQVKVTLAK
jgi:hypothetical protein